MFSDCGSEKHNHRNLSVQLQGCYDPEFTLHHKVTTDPLSPSELLCSMKVITDNAVTRLKAENLSVNYMAVFYYRNICNI